jgi:glycerol-3-phosphate acyltransferase PlsY
VDSELINSVGVVTIAYLLGAIPFGLILARRVAGIDVRQAGSGNIGATNVARSAGKTLGIVTLVLDCAKGALPILFSEHVLQLPLAVVAASGLAAVFGHVFPVYLRFRGGKGVATALGVFSSITPLPTAIAAGTFALAYLPWHLVSIGSLFASLALVVAVATFDQRREVLFLAIAVTAIVIARHKGNIARLLGKEEHKL